jgi:ribosomal-protein-serine acetyltransferase
MPECDPIMIDLPDTLVGERVVVRPWGAGDGAALYDAVQESLDHVRSWLPWGPLHESAQCSEKFVRKWKARWDTREDLPAGIWDKEDGTLLGGCGLHRIDWEVRSFEIGYWVRASKTGQGYATEAARLLTALAFDRLAANRVLIRVVVENAKSAAIPRRLGFVEEGLHRNAILDPRGNLRNLLVFALTPEDWRANPFPPSFGASVPKCGG